MRRFAIALVSILMAVLALGFFLLPSYPVTVTQMQINEAIADRLPFQTEQRVGSAVVNAGTVTFNAGNRVATEWELDTNTAMFSGSVSLAAALNIHYEDGAFYLKDLNHEEVQLTFLNEGAGAEDAARRDLGDLLVQGARNAFRAVTDDRAATQTFDPELTAALKRFLGGILQAFLNAFPIYDLRSAGGNIALAALVLEEVRIDDGQVTVVFAVQRLISQLFGAALVVMLLLLFVGRTAPLGRSD